MSYLHDKHVIGINVAYLIGDWIDMVFFGDQSFFLPNQQKLAAFPNLKVSCHAGVQGFKWVKYVAKQSEKTKGISTVPTMVSWNGNSGGAAISVAVHAGAKRIMLLGFDMSLNGKNNQHWHDLYKRGTNPNLKKMPFNRHLQGFPFIAKDAKRLGIEVINVSPESKIDVFRKVSLKEFISECS
jgi:hypothetical protein